MTLKKLDTLRPSDISLATAESQKSERIEFFSDNLDHLETLAYMAQIRLAITYLTGSKPAPKGRKKGHRIIHVKKENTLLQEPDLSFLGPSLEITTPRELKKQLDKIALETEEKTEASIERGVVLNFETICRSHNLDRIERIILSLFFANSTAMSFRELYAHCQLDPDDRQDGGMTMGSILTILNDDYREQIRNRKYFSIQSPLIVDEILIPIFSYPQTMNILDQRFYLHERLVRYVLGDNNIYNADFSGISKERSIVQLEQVILPKFLKDDILVLAQNYLKKDSKDEECRLSDFYGYGVGLTLLFYGPSGTGKTMLAHGLANQLKKELFSVDFQRINSTDHDELIQFVFNEARLSGGIVFFDECDDVFQRRTDTSRTLLIEIEKSECITILATNSVVDLDPALDRRITMKVLFDLPDTEQRKNIWEALLPRNIVVTEDVNFHDLARRYIFTGGLIKNVLFMAITNASPKSGTNEVVLTLQEIEKAAEYQAQSMFGLTKFEKVYRPNKSFSQLPIRNADKQKLQRISSAGKMIAEKDVGMKIVIGCSDINTGVDCVNAVANECGLEVSSYYLADLFSAKNTSDDLFDPFTQQKMTPLDWAFRQSPGRRSLKLLIDNMSIFKLHLKAMREGRPFQEYFVSFLDKIKFFNEMLYIVTPPVREIIQMGVFHHYMEIGFPPEEAQIQRWEKYLGSNQGIENRIVKIVEQYPLYMNEIDTIAQRAKLMSMIDNNQEVVDIDEICHLAKKFRARTHVPLLFGKDAR
ncbi:ATP-binding protein [Thermodesulfobacteriota bacterium]